MSVENPPFPLLEVASFIDATTVVVVGHRVDDLTLNDELYVLAVGNSTVPKTNVPLIVPKARLEVTFLAGVYALARSATIEKVKIPGVDFEALTNPFGSLAVAKTVERRKPLTNDEKLFTGSPADGAAVVVGDTVVRADDIADYIKWRAEQASSSDNAPF
jgi:hypothetical protein